MVDGKDNIKINSNETRAVLEYAKKLMAVIPPDVYAWDDAGILSVKVDARTARLYLAAH